MEIILLVGVVYGALDIIEVDDAIGSDTIDIRHRGLVIVELSPP